MVSTGNVYRMLVEVAKTGKVTTYSDVGRVLGLNADDYRDREKIGHILGDIACQENAEGRPMLSAVVIQPEYGCPDESFFHLAHQLEASLYYDDWAFYDSELKRVHEYWMRQGERRPQ